MMRASVVLRYAAAIVIAAAAVSPTFAGNRIVAIGDIHGNYDGFVAMLRTVGLVDENAHWSGGDTPFVQTGDVFDRGVEVFEVRDLLMRVEKEAAAAGGKVICLLGNHEGMNLIGFFRDVNPDLNAKMADKKSETRRKAAF